MSAFTLACAALAWVWTPLGYAPLIAVIVVGLRVSSAVEARRRLRAERADLATDAVS